MKRTAVMITLMSLLLISMSCAGGGQVSQRVNGTFAPDVQDIQDSPTREKACDCCQKCKAARRPLDPELQHDSAESANARPKNGCDNCCQKCGRPVQPSPEEIPPEIINKPRQK